MRLVSDTKQQQELRVYHPAASGVMEKRSVIFIETPSHLLQPPPEDTSTPTILLSNGNV